MLSGRASATDALRLPTTRSLASVCSVRPRRRAIGRSIVVNAAPVSITPSLRRRRFRTALSKHTAPCNAADRDAGSSQGGSAFHTPHTVQRQQAFWFIDVEVEVAQNVHAEQPVRPGARGMVPTALCGPPTRVRHHRHAVDGDRNFHGRDGDANHDGHKSPILHQAQALFGRFGHQASAATQCPSTIRAA